MNLLTRRYDAVVERASPGNTRLAIRYLADASSDEVDWPSMDVALVSAAPPRGAKRKAPPAALQPKRQSLVSAAS